MQGATVETVPSNDLPGGERKKTKAGLTKTTSSRGRLTANYPQTENYTSRRRAPSSLSCTGDMRHRHGPLVCFTTLMAHRFRPRGKLSTVALLLTAAGDVLLSGTSFVQSGLFPNTKTPAWCGNVPGGGPSGMTFSPRRWKHETAAGQRRSSYIFLPEPACWLAVAPSWSSAPTAAAGPRNSSKFPFFFLRTPQ